ncbi:MAG: NAD-dependent epimerase/dehydratase family protein [Symploca sp. SIO3C6]|uniref:NAD-dependent epimerase/dehydratase family protein n=1 Tax=Symploca sp. SIO1C4 TaxID=2607765 RepID=A0A6B3N985_9CYAN|nr:NAD-dependent epimerase/dehydratase family protein [Symploca sp. SIO3C6]NER27152.1 NAD-dependent epimerase/dehydratase family protein [Symploca sp. SIO1C4]
MTERILVLGGAGFIGSSLAIGLKKLHSNWQIICLDNLRRRGSELNLPRLKNWGIQFLHGDIRSSSDLDPGVLVVDTIIDCSAEPSVMAGFTSPQYVLQTNLVGTINILELARQINARLLFLSSSRVYPIVPLKSLNLRELPTRFEIIPEQILPGVSQLGVSEDFLLQGYRSLYGTTKLASELLIEEYRQAYNLSAIINRCGVVTGPWQMGKVDQGVFVLWVGAHHFQKPLNYIGYGGSGKQVRDLLHVEDLLRLVEYQLLHFLELDGEVFNVGGGTSNSLSLIETTQLCEAITGKSTQIKPVTEGRQGDIPIFITDSSKVFRKTGWQPMINPKAALNDIYGWICDNEAVLSQVLK